MTQFISTASKAHMRSKSVAVSPFRHTSPNFYVCVLSLWSWLHIVGVTQKWSCGAFGFWGGGAGDGSDSSMCLCVGTKCQQQDYDQNAVVLLLLSLVSQAAENRQKPASMATIKELSARTNNKIRLPSLTYVRY